MTETPPYTSWWMDCDTWDEFTRRAQARLDVLRRTSPKYLDHLGAQLSATSEPKYTARRES